MYDFSGLNLAGFHSGLVCAHPVSHAMHMCRTDFSVFVNPKLMKRKSLTKATFQIKRIRTPGQPL